MTGKIGTNFDIRDLAGLVAASHDLDNLDRLQR